MRRWWGGDRARRWAPVAAWLLVIFTLSTGWFGGDTTGFILLPVLRWLLPTASYRELLIAHDVVRKLAHFAEFLVLGVLLYRALDGRTFNLRVAFRAFALAALCALGDELHQAFVPGRTPALTDCLIDAAGAAAGLALLAAHGRGFTARVPARP